MENLQRSTKTKVLMQLNDMKPGNDFALYNINKQRQTVITFYYSFLYVMVISCNMYNSNNALHVMFMFYSNIAVDI